MARTLWRRAAPWSSCTQTSLPMGSARFMDWGRPTNHAEHETIEITQGINDWSEVGFYIFTSEQSGRVCNG